MRFDTNRAKAVGEYALYGILQEAIAGKAKGDGRKAYCISVSKEKLAEALGVKRLHDTHLIDLAKAARKWGMALGDLGNVFYFFIPTEIEVFDADPVIQQVSTAFVNVYGSPACDELYDDATQWWPSDATPPKRPTGARVR